MSLFGLTIMGWGGGEWGEERHYNAYCKLGNFL